MSSIPDYNQYYVQFLSVVNLETLAQTWHVKMWRWKAKYIEFESDFIAHSIRLTFRIWVIGICCLGFVVWDLQYFNAHYFIALSEPQGLRAGG